MEEDTVYDIHDEKLKEMIKPDGNYARFEKNVPQTVVILSPKVKPTDVEYEGKIRTRFSIKVQVNGEEKIWTVSKSVLRIIVDNYDNTKTFHVMLEDKKYSIIPIISPK